MFQLNKQTNLDIEWDVNRRTINAKVTTSFLSQPLFLESNDLLSIEWYATVMEAQTFINNKIVNPFETY